MITSKVSVAKGKTVAEIVVMTIKASKEEDGFQGMEQVQLLDAIRNICNSNFSRDEIQKIRTISSPKVQARCLMFLELIVQNGNHSVPDFDGTKEVPRDKKLGSDECVSQFNILSKGDIAWTAFFVITLLFWLSYAICNLELY